MKKRKKNVYKLSVRKYFELSSYWFRMLRLDVDIEKFHDTFSEQYLDIAKMDASMRFFF